MKKLLIILFVLAKRFFIPALLLTISYCVRQHEQKQMDDSLRLMQSAPLSPSAGGDALFLLNYDVADANTRRQWIAQYGINALQNKDEATSNALPQTVRAAKLPDIPKDSLSCPPRNSDSGCLETVRRQLPVYRQRLQQSAKLLANADALSQYDNFDYRIQYTDAFPPFAPVVAQRIVAAVDWVENRKEAALARICRNIRTGRVLLRSRGGLVDTMVGSAVVARNTELAAEMLAEEPEWATRLPENCAVAFASFVRNEPDLCAAMQGEFRSFDGSLQSWMADDVAKMDGRAKFLARLVRIPVLNNMWFSYEHARRLQAKNLAQFCTAASKEAVKQDKQLEFAAPPAKENNSMVLRPACWGNFVGCKAADTVAQDYAVYNDSLLDMLMQQRAFQAALALYALPETERRAVLPKILQQHSSPARQLSYDEKKKQIVFERYDQREKAVAKGVAVRLD